MTKPKKTFLSRLKITKSGKVLSRKSGQNHFNAKESRRTQLAKHRFTSFRMTSRQRRAFLVR